MALKENKSYNHRRYRIDHEKYIIFFMWSTKLILLSLTSNLRYRFLDISVYRTDSLAEVHNM